MLDSARVLLSWFLRFALLPALGCIRPSVECAPFSGEIEPSAITASGEADERTVALESRPSPAAASLLPSGARYRLIATAEEIALLVVTPDNRISGRLRIRPLDRLDGYGSTIVIDDFSGPEATIDTWSSAGGLFGQARVGERRAAWKVRVDTDGNLAGEHWSVRHGSHSAEIETLHVARAIGADIRWLASELARSGVLAPGREGELTERAMLAELALELTVRAWEGRGRASLPRVGG